MLREDETREIIVRWLKVRGGFVRLRKRIGQCRYRILEPLVAQSGYISSWFSGWEPRAQE